MQLFGTGINYTSGELLVNALDEQDFGRTILGSLRQNAERFHGLAAAREIAFSFKGELEAQRSTNLANPLEAGWTYLVNKRQPNWRDFAEALRPLAEHRGMAEPASPLVFHDEDEDEWGTWLQDNYSALDTGQVPYYILIVGNPQCIPFHFQSLLQSAGAVGRVDFDSPDELSGYVEKVIRLEKAQSPVVERNVLVFAPDAGPADATYYSRRHMAEPLAQRVQDAKTFHVRRMIGTQARKQDLLGALKGAKPSLVYTASHGLAAPQESLDIQMHFNGAICCQPSFYGEPLRDRLFAAEDVPLDEPFLEGAVFFQFACFGYGTPAQSDFAHWLPKGTLEAMNAKEDFVAALPKKLLSHAHGPIAFIGHVDAAWMHGFVDNPHHPDIAVRWQHRIEPFVNALNTLLEVQPVALAMTSMNKRYDLQNAQLTNTFDRIRRGNLEVTSELEECLAEAFVLRSDAQNYMVFGDPATHLRIPLSDG